MSHPPARAVARILQLSPVERAWLDDLRGWWQSTGVDGSDIAAVCAYFDDFRSAWFDQDEVDRPDPNPLINAVGVSIGDHLVRSADMQWVINDDGTTLEMAVHRTPGHFVVCAMNAVAQRWNAQPRRGFVSGLVAYVEQSIDPVVARHPRIQPNHSVPAGEVMAPASVAGGDDAGALDQVAMGGVSRTESDRRGRSDGWFGRTRRARPRFLLPLERT